MKFLILMSIDSKMSTRRGHNTAKAGDDTNIDIRKVQTSRKTSKEDQGEDVHTNSYPSSGGTELDR